MIPRRKQAKLRPCRFAAIKKTNLVHSSECMSIVDADMRFPLWLPELRSPSFPDLSAVISLLWLLWVLQLQKYFFFCFNNECHIENEQTIPYLSTWYQLTPSRQIWTVGSWHWNSFGNCGSISIQGWHTLGGLWHPLGMTGAIPQTLFLRLSLHLKGLFRVTWVKTTFYCCNISRPKKTEPCSCIY